MEATVGEDTLTNPPLDENSPDKPLHRLSSSLSLNSDDSDDDDIDNTSSQMLEGLNVNSKIKNLLKYTSIDTSSSEDEDDVPAAAPKPALALPPRKPRVPTSSIISRMEKRTDWTKNPVFTKSPAPQTPDTPVADQDVAALSVSPATAVREVSPPTRNKANKAQFRKILNDMLAEESSSDDDDERLYTRQKRLQEEMTPQKKPRTPKKSPKNLPRTKKSSKDDGPKVISAKAKMELHKESERLYRSTDVKLRVSSQPKKTMASFLEKVQSAKKTSSSNTQKKSAPFSAGVMPEFDQAIGRANEKVLIASDSDSDLEIVGSADQPKTLASTVGSVYSPVRFQVSPKQKRRTPVKKGTTNLVPAMTHKDLNASLKQAISLEMLKRRQEMEVRLKEKGLYTSAEELARKHMDREKEAQSIHDEVERLQARNLKSTSHHDSQSDSDDSYASEKEDWPSGSEAEDDRFRDSEDDEHQGIEPVEEAAPVIRRNRKMAIISDDDEDDNDEPVSGPTAETPSVQDISASDSDSEPARVSVRKHQKSHLAFTAKPRAPLPKSQYVEQEAEEEEDEYMGLGGVEGEDDDGPDEYVEDDVVVHTNDEALDEAQLRQAFNNQMADSDQNEIQRLIKDVVSGGLRRRRGAMNDGYELDYYDTFDDEDDNLVALRRAAAAKRRKLLSGNILEAIADNPQTAAFAKASRVDIDEDEKPSFSDGEEEESQPVAAYDYGGDHDEKGDGTGDEDDEEEIATFAQTVAAMKQSSIREETVTVMQDIAFITEEPISNQVEEDTWSSVTITQRKVATKNFTSPLQPNRIRSSPLFRSPGKLQKFKNLLQEAGGSIGGSNETGSHVGFSAPSRSQDDRSASISSQRSNSSSTTASQESYTPLSRKNSRLLDILSSQESSIF